MTAEGVARLTRKPLFTIGVSDIGTTSHVIETKLADVFRLASIWKAVLLMYIDLRPRRIELKTDSRFVAVMRQMSFSRREIVPTVVFSETLWSPYSYVF